MSTVRVRYAPSPTGYLHIGGARTALFNWLFARRYGGSLVLRIEDTDVSRGKEGSVEGMTRGFKWLGLDWDEGPEKGGPYGPYFQSRRGQLYKEAAMRLVDSGAAYYCYCTVEELTERREAARREGRPPRYDGRCRHLSIEEQRRLEADGRRPAIRLVVPDEGATTYEDIIRGPVSFDNSTIDDLVLVRSDGMPTYNFACVVDDHSMAISHVIRADEHISNTPKQLRIYQALGWEPPRFAHVPMILAPDRSKMSKRHGATSVEEYRDLGFLPEAVVNYLAFLGWTPQGESEFLGVEEMIPQFALEDVNRGAAIYDLAKMQWVNAHYLRSMDVTEITRRAIPFYVKEGLLTEAPAGDAFHWLVKVVAAMRERVKTLAELPPATSYFFGDQFDYEEKAWQKYFAGERREQTVKVLTQARDLLASIADFTIENTEAGYRKLVEDLGISGGDLFHPTRVALSGRTVGPGLFDVITLLGRERCVERLDRAIEKAGGRRMRPAAG